MGDELSQSAQREVANTPLVHPDCRDPAAEFQGWLRRLVREARAAGVDDDRLVAAMHERADDLADEIGGG